jgi:hypothetical protein
MEHEIMADQWSVHQAPDEDIWLDFSRKMTCSRGLENVPDQDTSGPIAT